MVLVIVGFVLPVFPPVGAWHQNPGMALSDPTLKNEAERLYLSHDLRLFEAPPAPNFAELFPGYSLVLVMEVDRHPVIRHVMAYHSGLGKGFDATRDFGLLQSTYTVNSATMALKFARAFGEVGNAEIEHHRHLLTAFDTWVGVPTSDPVVTETLTGWKVEYASWGDLNGVLADWEFQFSAGKLSRAEWEIRSMAVGPDTPKWKAMNVKTGMVFSNSYAATHTLTATFAGQTLNLPNQLGSLTFTPVNTRDNYDGSTWQTSYAGTPNGGVTDLSDRLLPRAASAYANLVGSAACNSATNPSQNWGLRSRDTNCILQIFIVPANTLYCGACLRRGNEIALYVAEDVVNFVKNDVAWYNDPTQYTADDILDLTLRHLLLATLAITSADQLPEIAGHAPNETFVRDDGSIDPEHFLLRHGLDPALRAVTASACPNPPQGLCATVPERSGCSGIVVRFNPGSPEIDPLLRRGWHCSWDARDQLRPVVEFPDGSFPIVSIGAIVEDPVGPGSKIIGVDVAYPPHPVTGDPRARRDLACTGGFLVKEANGPRSFLATAGHCFLPVDDEDPAEAIGDVAMATVNKSGFRLQPRVSVVACYADCSLGVFASDAGELCPQGTNDLSLCARFWTDASYDMLGTVAYAIWDGIGRDFGLVEIDAKWLAPGLLRATVPRWDGPTGQQCQPIVDPMFPQLALFYGNGAALGEHRVIKGRGGLFLGDCWNQANPDNATVSALVAGPGDSGGPIVHGSFGVSPRGSAGLAVISGASADRRSAGVVGTSLEYGFSLVHGDLGVDLALVCDVQQGEFVTC